MSQFTRPRLLAALAVVASMCLTPAASGTAGAFDSFVAQPRSTFVDSDGDGLSDAFETAGGVSDPLNADTDGDGLIDAAEDPDGDGLSNLGEQRFGTSPALADTDGNGTPDGSEDSDHDGVSNALQQDDRPVPANPTPSLAHAPQDLPVSYHDGCDVHPSSNDFQHCVYGNPAASHSVALLGDSHAAEWLPALISAANSLGWRVINLTRSGCPSAWVNVYSPYQHGLGTWCNSFRRRALAWLQAQPPDMVIISNKGDYKLFWSSGRQVSAGNQAHVWSAGLGRTLGALPDRSKVVVLADSPQPRVLVPACLSAHLDDIAACELPRSRTTEPVHAALEAQVAAQHGATFANLEGQTCPYNPCPVMAGNVVMWRDQGHMTATFSRELAPSMERVVAAAAGS